MPETEVQIDVNGPSIEVEVTIGQPVRGRYEVTLWDPTGKKKQQVGQGRNYDDVADRFAVEVAPSQLHNSALEWDYLVDLGPAPGNRRAEATVRIWQGSRELHTENATLSGKGVTPGWGYVRLVLGGN